MRPMRTTTSHARSSNRAAARRRSRCSTDPSRSRAAEARFAKLGPGANSIPLVHLLVTGAAGFIGSNFVHYWVGRHPEDRVVALDLLTYAGNRANLEGVEQQIDFVEGDIADLEL